LQPAALERALLDFTYAVIPVVTESPELEAVSSGVPDYTVESTVLFAFTDEAWDDRLLQECTDMIDS
jgi:hypothetical protein